MSILFHLIGLTLFSASASFISIYFYKILMLWNTIICSSDCFAKSSILLCLHGAYCLNRVCTQKTFNLSRLALSIIIFVTLFRVGFLNLLFGCVCVERGEGRGKREGAELPLYLNFCLTTARGMKLWTGYLQCNWIRMMQIYSLWRSWIWIKKKGGSFTAVDKFSLITNDSRKRIHVKTRVFFFFHL